MNRRRSGTIDEATDGRRRPRVLVAEANPLLGAGIRQVLEASGRVAVGWLVTTVADAIDACVNSRPDVAIVSGTLAPTGASKVIREIRVRSPGTAVIATAPRDQSALLLEALRAGAIGLAPNDAACDELVAIVERAAAGNATVASSLATSLVFELAQSAPAEPEPVPLTPREIEVLGLLAAGSTNAEIARSLIVAIGTVKVHVEHILAKLGARDRTDAAVRAVELGLVRAPGSGTGTGTGATRDAAGR